MLLTYIQFFVYLTLYLVFFYLLGSELLEKYTDKEAITWYAMGVAMYLFLLLCIITVLV